jgi:hypothetical protein
MENSKRKLSSDEEQERIKRRKEKNFDFNYGFLLESNFPKYSKTLDFKETSPEREYLHSKLIIKFHNDYETKFKSLFFMRSAPKDSLNRFLYEQLSLQKKYAKNEISFLKPENILEMDTIDKEIRTAFPLTCTVKSLKGSIWKIKKNINDCLYIGGKFSEESGLFVKNFHLKEMLKENKFERFEQLRQNYFASFETLFERKIKELKTFLFNSLNNLISNMNKEVKASEQLVTFFEKSEPNQNSFIYIKYKDSEFKLTRYHFRKIKKLFELNQISDPHLKKFEDLVFNLICRYQTFFRSNEFINEGYGMQAALPGNLFKELNRTFNVTEEMFASPFNCYFKKYCSAFLDTDYYFGSNGSFFDYKPVEGVFLIIYS